MNSSPARHVVDETPLVVTPTRIAVTRLPERLWSESGACSFILYVEWRSEGKYAVVDDLRSSYNREGERQRESLPSSRTEEYLQSYRFSKEEALQVAARVLPQLRLRTWTVEEFIERVDAWAAEAASQE